MSDEFFVFRKAPSVPCLCLYESRWPQTDARLPRSRTALAPRRWRGAHFKPQATQHKLSAQAKEQQEHFFLEQEMASPSITTLCLLNGRRVIELGR